jgi:hypothetical protein
MSISEFHRAWRQQERKMKAFEEDLFSKPPDLP